MSSTPQTYPTAITIYLDCDGTIAKDLGAYDGLCETIDGLYYPMKGLDRARLQERFDAVLVPLADKRYGEEREHYDGVSVVNGVLTEMLLRGELAGLNNEVLRHIGREYIKPFPGVIETMRDMRRLAQIVSDGEITVEFVINSCNFREALVGSVFGDLMSDKEGHLVREVTGQVFSQSTTAIELTVGGKNTVLRQTDGIIKHYLPETKGHIVSSDMRAGRSSEGFVVCVGDGLTDVDMFAANRAGWNVLVHSSLVAKSDGHARNLRFIKDSSFVHLEIPNVWTPFPFTGDPERLGPLYSPLASIVGDLTLQAQARRHDHATFDRGRDRRSSAQTNAVSTYQTKGRGPISQALVRVLEERVLRESMARTVASDGTRTLHSGEKSLTNKSLEAFITAAQGERPTCVLDAPSTQRVFNAVGAQDSGPITLVIPSSAYNDDRIRTVLAKITGLKAEDVKLPELSGASRTLAANDYEFVLKRSSAESGLFDSQLQAAIRGEYPLFSTTEGTYSIVGEKPLRLLDGGFDRTRDGGELTRSLEQEAFGGGVGGLDAR